MSLGIWPSTRHDADGWSASDGFRQVKAKLKMAARAAIVYIKGDWCEHAHTLGLPLWSDSLRH